ncbi:EamA family transporter RarD [Salinibacterium hongtaonis]|nr:EamA family transporter RarD [Salinibacterium hongtaonis]
MTSFDGAEGEWPPVAYVANHGHLLLRSSSVHPAIAGLLRNPGLSFCCQNMQVPHPSESLGLRSRGVIASIAASVLFGVVYFIPAALGDLGTFEAVSWRIILTVPFMVVLLIAIKSWRSVVATVRLIAARPLVVLPLVLVSSALLGLQLWLFAWGPSTGHGLDVAIGYLLMPLVMVVVGVIVHGERLGALRTVAVGAALVGVAAAFFAADGLSWATAAVAIGYPIYFVIRRALGIDTPGAMLVELVILLVPSVWFAVGPGSVVAQGGELPIAMLVMFGAVSAVALTLYIVASRLLSFSLFGLLSYVEPIVLVAVSIVLLGESIDPSEYLTYAGIGLALVLLGVEGWRSVRSVPDAGEPPAVTS